MTTKKQISSIWSELLARHGDLLLCGPYLVLKPQRHVMRSISIDRSSDADYPSFCWHVGHAFDPVGSLGGLAPEPIFLERGKPNRWSQAGFFDTVFDALEHRILPMLRRVQGVEDMDNVEGEPGSFEYKGWLSHEPYRISILAALGRFDDVVPIYETIKDWHRTMKNGWQPRFERASGLGALVAEGDHAGVAALLHGWEEQFIARNHLEAIYEKTPFPFEAASGA